MKTPSLLQHAWRLLVGLTLLALVSACASNPSAAPPPPRLVVLLVVDGLPQRQITAYRDQLAPDGLARFLDRGTWYSEAYYGHAFTVTAAGHATMLSGAYPHRSGIIGNEWLDPVTGKAVYCTEDTAATYIGHKTSAFDGTSPKNLKVQTVGDMLRQADPRSKVIAISGKDRGAILPAGQRGTAYMYMSSTGQFASSTFYMREHPEWVNRFNAAKPADRFFNTQWKPLLEESAYARSLPDQQKWFMRNAGLPMQMGGGDEPPGPRFYGSLLASPFADMLSLDFARAAIAGEGLGQDDVPDILSVSLSGHDYINHAFSAESRLSHDHMLQLDRMFQAFFRDLDERVGKDKYVVVLTADHGFMPAPERSQALGVNAGRFSGGQMLARVNAGLEKSFGPGKWVRGVSGSTLLFDQQLIASKGVAAAEVHNAARDLLLAEPGIAAAFTRAELMSGSKADAPFFAAMQKAWNREVSGDVQLAVKPYWMFASSTSTTTHGSPHEYDTHVPIAIYGPRWAAPGRVDSRVEVVDIAPTLARWLGVAAPATAEGKPLPMPAR